MTLRTPHIIWGGRLPTTVLGTHLLRKWIFLRNCPFAEQHRTHVLGSAALHLIPWLRRTFCSQPSESKQPTDTTGAAGKCIWQWKTGNITRGTKCRGRKEETLTLKNTIWKGCSFWKLIFLPQIRKEENIVKIIVLSFYTATVFCLRFPLRPVVTVALIQHVPIWASFHYHKKTRNASWNYHTSSVDLVSFKVRCNYVPAKNFFLTILLRMLLKIHSCAASY